MLFAAFAIAMAVPSSRQRIQDEVFTPITDDIGTRLVPRRLRVMADQLDVRLGRAERMPTTFEGWLRRDYSGPETDPWGNSWYLRPGRTSYTVVEAGDALVLRAESNDENSALVSNQRRDPAGLRLQWRWRVLEHPDDADPEQRRTDDRAAGVIVIVRHSFFPWRTRARAPTAAA